MAHDNVIVLKPVRPCPICKKPSSQTHHPFCSARCADIDLNRWLSGRYVIPGTPDPGDDEEEATDLPTLAGDEDDNI